MAGIWLLLVLLVSVAGFFVWRWRGRPGLAAEGLRLLRLGRVSEASEHIAPYLAVHPRDVTVRLAWAEALANEGAVDEALELLRKGVFRHEDHRLWMLIGVIHLAQGDLGPARQIGSRVWNLERLRRVDETAWRRDRYQEALQAFRRARDIAPGETQPATAIAETLDRVEDRTGSVQAWREVENLARESPQAHLGLANALRQVGDVTQAATEYETALALDPRAGGAYEGLAELQAEAGASSLAEVNRRKAFFYGWIPEALNVDYSDEVCRWVEDLHAPTLVEELENEADDERLERHATRDAKSRALARRRRAVERLVAEDSPTSSALLAAFCMHHSAHGELEEKAFSALESRGEAGRDLLMTLLAHGSSLCTKRQAAQALARHRDRRAVPLLLTLLPQDTNRIWRMGIADALARIGDARAVEPLIDVLDPRGASDIDDPTVGGEEDSPFEPMSHFVEDVLSNRWRCALALGHFTGARAQTALREGLANETIRVPCLAALYRLTGEVDHLARLERHCEGLDELQIGTVAAYLHEIDPAAADRLRKSAEPR